MKFIKYLVLVGCFSSHTIWAMLPAPLPDFQKEKRFSPVRPAPVNLQNSDVFYTARPYEESRAGYLFKFRTLDSKLSRWQSEDPSGFPDGANNQGYRPCPTSELDPLGLRTLTGTHTTHNISVSGVPTTGSNGTNLSINVITAPTQIGGAENIQAKSEVSWSVTAGAAGYVVQHVLFDYSGVFYENGTPYNTTNIEYWEAWTVDSSNNIWVDPGMTAAHVMDTFRTEAFPQNTYGTVSIIGKVDFYRTTVVGADDPASWGSVAQAGSLPATTSQPSWWTGSGFNHTLVMSWE